MKFIVMAFATSAGGWIGWWLGEKMGFMTAFVLSTVGAGVGMYVAKRFSDAYGG